MRLLAATVSVAHRTLPSISISVSVRAWKKLLIRIRYSARSMNPITVPTMPRKLIIPKF